jgi:hypothetical protein
MRFSHPPITEDQHLHGLICGKSLFNAVLDFVIEQMLVAKHEPAVSLIVRLKVVSSGFQAKPIAQENGHEGLQVASFQHHVGFVA